jgi:hypothetical protein
MTVYDDVFVSARACGPESRAWGVRFQQPLPQLAAQLRNLGVVDAAHVDRFEYVDLQPGPST